ncbi:MAG: hypothetical protein GF333_08130 [Candidatus Omnitrophica bacterium]|nr:hypothetical protein [Candidatus Omnitrophota bacterium]
MVERRKYPRVKKNLPLKISDDEYDILTETKNISGSGVYCSVNKPIPIMTKLNMVLLVPLKKNRNKGDVKKINCEGVVVRSEQMRDNGEHPYRVGIYFNDIKEKDRKALVSYINTAVKAGIRT